jgi:hypothetical protein
MKLVHNFTLHNCNFGILIIPFRKYEAMAKFNRTNFVNPLSKDLDYFIACAESNSFLKAAESLDIQQAGLSKIIQKLEYNIGQNLFHRSVKGIELTPYGKALHQSLAQTKNYWKDIYTQHIQDSLGPSGALSIGCHPSVASSRFPKVLPTIIQSYPHLKLDVCFDTSVEITRKVADLKIDIGLVVNPVKNADLILKNIEAESVGLWKKTAKPAEVLCYNPDMFTVEKLLKKYPQYKLIPIKDYEVIANLINESDFVGILPQTIAERHRLKAIEEKIFDVNIGLIWHKDRFTQPGRRQIVDSILISLKS